MRRTTCFAIPCALALTVLALSGCGGSAKTTRTTSSSAPAATKAATAPTQTSTAPSTQTSTAATTTVSSGSGDRAATTTGPVRATLHASSHAPVAGKNWAYTVTAADASGHPLAGSVTSEFVFGGQVVGRETPPTHTLKDGRFHEVIQYPARAVGIPLNFQAVVHTSAGTVTLDWPVRVKP